MKNLEELLAEAGRAHGHLCAGQVLGVRMALYGLRLLDIDNPTGKNSKRLIIFVEIDRCATDAITVVTGCRLGQRTLKFRDFGKMAATFCDIQGNRAVRLVALDSAKNRAMQMYPELQNKNLQQMKVYRELPDEDLFAAQWVRVRLDSEDLPGYKKPEALCSQCGESIQFGREILREGIVLCRACAGQRYYDLL